MEKIEFLIQQKERSRSLFLQTGDRGHLKDMNYFEKRIKKEERRPLEQVEWFVIGAVLVTIASPFINFFIFRLKNGF